jgi:hypothetical protein
MSLSPIRSCFARFVLSLICLAMLSGCHRTRSGRVVPDVPLIVAASVLGDGRILVDPLATAAAQPPFSAVRRLNTAITSRVAP